MHFFPAIPNKFQLHFKYFFQALQLSESWKKMDKGLSKFGKVYKVVEKQPDLILFVHISPL